MKEFDLEYWKKHQPRLVTREGDNARILATDMKGFLPICFAYEHEVVVYEQPRETRLVESPLLCKANGRVIGDNTDYELDLFMVEE